jgi:TRAP-type C4-dicarboxylate transport system substrate-binding protein
MVTAILVLSLAIMVGPALAGPRSLRFQVNYPGTSYGGASMKYFAKQVEKLSGGQLKVQLFFAGQILKTRQAFSAMQRGMVDGLYSALLYYGGIVREAFWEWLPFTWASPKQAVDLYVNHGLLKLMQTALKAHGIRYLAPIPMGTLAFLTKFKVKTVADFKGKKIRGAGPQAAVIKLLGGSSVALAAAEQYTSLQRGTIEGTIYPLYTIGVYKLYEVIDYVVLPGVYSPCVIDLMMNLKTWNSLSPAMKKVVTRAAMNTMRWTAGLNLKWDAEGIAVTRKHKVKICRLSPAEVKRLRAMTKPLWDKVAARSPLSARAVAIIRNYMKNK